MIALRSRSAVIFILPYIVACTGAQGQPPTPSATPPPATSTSTLVPSPPTHHTPTSTLTPVPTPVILRGPPDPRHALLFALNHETGQSIYLYDLETDEAKEIYALPPTVSLHDQVEVTIYPLGGASKASLPPGLPPDWMFLSYNGTRLATLQPAYGGFPNYIHQIDLLTGEVTSVRVFQNYRLTIPSSSSRRPVAEPLDEGLEALVNIAYMFYGLSWQPTDQGFGFILGSPMDFGVLPQQIYYVPWGTTSVVPLAMKVPGETSGLRAEWSPDGKYIAYVHPNEFPNQADIWLIDVDRSQDVIQLGTTIDPPSRLFWSPDSRFLYYQDALPRVVEPDMERIMQISVPGGEPEVLFEIRKADDEIIDFRFGGIEFAGDLLVVYEAHRVLGADPTRSGVYAIDPARSRLLTIDVSSGEVAEAFVRRPIEAFRPSPAGGLAWAGMDRRECAIVLVPQGSFLRGPHRDPCRAAVWSPDGYFLAGQSESDILLYNVRRDSFWAVAEQLGGEKVFLGWVPEPGVYDAILSD
ncbi:MAG: TolB family protein [Anaerolineales bacterium]